jgi:hypothetical protein
MSAADISQRKYLVHQVITMPLQSLNYITEWNMREKLAVQLSVPYFV